MSNENLAPKWVDVLNTLISQYVHYVGQPSKAAHNELVRMAEVADTAATLAAEADQYRFVLSCALDLLLDLNLDGRDQKRVDSMIDTLNATLYPPAPGNVHPLGEKS